MAKRNRPTVDVKPVEEGLTAKTIKAVKDIAKPFASFVSDYTALAMKREELAPRFMKAFGLWQAETGRSFVDFVRYLVPEVGAARNEYRNHRAYQAADYLRRLAQQQQREAEGGNRRRSADAAATAPATPMNGMARLLKSLIPIIPEDQRQRVWEALHAELHWSDRQINRIQGLVTESAPLIDVTVPRGQHLPNLRIAVHETTPEENIGAEGQRAAA